MGRIGVLTALLLLPASLAGCGSSTLMNTTSLTPDKAADAGGSAYMTAEDTASSGPSSGFNPYAEQAAVPPGGREVIPDPTIADVMATGSLPEMSFGRDDAPVTIVEYASLTCPHCRNFHMKTYPQFKKAYIDTGKVRFVTRDFPLGFHKNAKSAAIASRCAGEQGKFWEFRSVLASNADKLFPAAVLGYAGASGLDVKSFQACLAADRFAAALQKDLDDAGATGVTGTPTFVIGKTAPGKMEGVKIVGALPFAAFDQKIRALLPPDAPPATP